MWHRRLRDLKAGELSIGNVITHLEVNLEGPETESLLRLIHFLHTRLTGMKASVPSPRFACVYVGEVYRDLVFAMVCAGRCDSRTED
jgi:hypothetical protein